MRVIRIMDSEKVTVNTVTDEVIAAKGYAWKARVLGEVPVFVAIGDGVTATDEDFYVNEFDEKIFSVGAQEDLALLGDDNGDVWVAEIELS